jgi:hypothetical protein
MMFGSALRRADKTACSAICVQPSPCEESAAGVQ